jgi:hypothetical protein
MKHRSSQPKAEVAAELDRIERILGYGREILGTRAHSAQVCEWACGTDPGELAELFADRIAGERC